MKNPVFRGTATALVTPFVHGKIDEYAYTHLLDRQRIAQIAAVVVCGTTGEASTLSRDERRALYGLTAQKCKWIAGIGTNSTYVSTELAKEAADYGADALLAVTPYYNKCTQDGLIRHYTSIADSTKLPLILYNVPSRTGVNISPETCQILCTHENINGIKEASGSISAVAKIRALCGTDFNIWTGNDDQIVPTMSLGGKGVISVLSNLCPNKVNAISKACLKGEYELASRLQCKAYPLIEALFSEVNPIPVKAAMAEWKLCNNEIRLPLTAMTKDKKDRLMSIISTYLEDVESKDP